MSNFEIKVHTNSVPAGDLSQALLGRGLTALS